MKKYNLNYFISKNYSFVLIKNNRIIYKSKNQGLKPLVFCLKKYEKEMRRAMVFDKIVGLAAAKLLVYGKVAEVWTPIISREGKIYLRKYKVKIIYKKEVKNIMNQNGDDLCPMEKMCQRKALKEFLRNLSIY